MLCCMPVDTAEKLSNHSLSLSDPFLGKLFLTVDFS